MSISKHDLVSTDLMPARSDAEVHALHLAQTTSGIGLIIVDGIRHSLSLDGLAGQLEIFLDDIEILTSDDGVETLRYDHKLLPAKRKLRIEMGANEASDLKPHFHVTHNNECASYDLKDYNWLGGAVVAPNKAEMVRRFFVYYGAGERMALIMRPEFGERRLRGESDTTSALKRQLNP